MYELVADEDDSEHPLLPPLVPPWKAVRPAISSSDAQLSAKELEWLALPTVARHNREKMALWGFHMPERLR